LCYDQNDQPPREDVMMSRRSSASHVGAHANVLVFLLAWSLVASGCSKGGSANQSSATSSAAPTAAATVATNDLMAKLPVYPGASKATDSTGTVAGKRVVQQVWTTPDPFDKVYAWYQTALPANSQTAHDTTQMQESAVFTLSGGTTQQTVSILKTSGVEVTNITLTVTGS
jgi:hypothetical protein